MDNKSVSCRFDIMAYAIVVGVKVEAERDLTNANK
jgi:hypothetical protein